MGITHNTACNAAQNHGIDVLFPSALYSMRSDGRTRNMLLDGRSLDLIVIKSPAVSLSRRPLPPRTQKPPSIATVA